ncbi:helix-turn-helix transcriptional regulator [Nocardia neocaledoniensis]|uniref:helix-turn-helix domain-containing protein n=1 Tax=Nocardia TaxID=1817 RepID=UPI001E304E1C|nr:MULTISPECIES: helix-turn-helix transcriptional regulator [Nocardia]UGT55246.1 helix-turn-helix domain-containing protein [Nocardia asteroides]
MSTIGKAIRAARMASGFTQAELADWIGISDANQISRWERDVVTPSAGNVGELSRVLGVRLDNSVGNAVSC